MTAKTYIENSKDSNANEAVVNSPTGIEASICADIFNRQQLGIAKYGTTVAENPLALRAWLQHAYEECLDQAVYLRRAIAEIDNAKDNGQSPVDLLVDRKGEV